MSRLFSRLENRGQDEAGLAPPAGPALVPGAHPAAEVPAEAGSGSAAPSPAAANSPDMPPLVPGYAISTSLSLPALPPPPVPGTRPAWAVRLWLASLLLLIGLSVLVLAMPERLLPGAVQRTQNTQQAAPAVPAAASDAPPSAAAAGSPAPPPASAIVTVVPRLPSTSAPRAEPRSRTAPPAPPAAAGALAPLPSGGSAACSEAMLAMNLCSKSSP